MHIQKSLCIISSNDYWPNYNQLFIFKPKLLQSSLKCDIDHPFLSPYIKMLWDQPASQNSITTENRRIWRERAGDTGEEGNRKFWTVHHPDFSSWYKQKLHRKHKQKAKKNSLANSDTTSIPTSEDRGTHREKKQTDLRIKREN